MVDDGYAELQRRVRNSLALVRSIARRTAETSDTVEQFGLHLDGRLGVFARTQTAVTRDPGGGIDLESIIAEELLAHIAWEGEHTHVHGPEIRLQAKPGETLALAFHELASNAVKYDALSVPGGGRVSWQVDDGLDGQDQLVIVWDEDRPGEALSPPARRGFGTDLLESTLHYELEADTLLDFRPAGLHCVIILPLNEEIGRKA